MALSGPHQRFLLIEQGAVPTVFNFALNGAIAWALFRSAEEVPLWGESSVGVDLLATAFLLPFLTCLIVSAIVARHVRDGKVPPLRASSCRTRAGSSARRSRAGSRSAPRAWYSARCRSCGRSRSRRPSRSRCPRS